MHSLHDTVLQERTGHITLLPMGTAGHEVLFTPLLAEISALAHNRAQFVRKQPDGFWWMGLAPVCTQHIRHRTTSVPEPLMAAVTDAGHAAVKNLWQLAVCNHDAFVISSCFKLWVLT